MGHLPLDPRFYGRWFTEKIVARRRKPLKLLSGGMLRLREPFTLGMRTLCMDLVLFLRWRMDSN